MSTGRIMVVDAGNTRTKWAFFRDGRMQAYQVALNADTRTALEAEAPVDLVAYSAVGDRTQDLAELLGRFGRVLRVSGESPAAIQSDYNPRHSLGPDRWANAVGAHRLFGPRAVLAIGMGTCLTYDVVDASGVHRGGLISPGLRMRAEAMHRSTARLPLVTEHGSTELLGTDTLHALASGAFNGMAQEVKGVVRELRQQHPDLAVVVTGGDAPALAHALENGIFVHPFLTLLGLYALALHHASSIGHGRPA